ncbi:MAG TPA: T9SS type A sorting domain-containing protein [Ignavibacteria bacterium]|mgnify:FL=1|nr:T9SS type A sorting domain-containing protein [Ignavibacteria bacterium]
MMKLLFIVIPVFLIFCESGSTFSWDSTAAKYYPLQIGNSWTYNRLVFSGPSPCTNLTENFYYRVAITGDTLMPNNKRYFVFQSTYLSNVYRRIDSASMNIYQYSTSSGNECKYDSLFAAPGNFISGCNIYVLNGFSTISFGGSIRSLRTLGAGACPAQCLRKFVLGIGYYGDEQCVTGGSRTTLNGCVINGVLYGDTSLILGIMLSGIEIPNECSLSQNYPNPFNPVTKIKFSIPLSRGVGAEGGRGVLTQLSIYDALGKEITVLINQQLQPGTYEADWDASAYPSGVYYYKLEVSPSTGSGRGFTETKKMVLIK